MFAQALGEYGVAAAIAIFFNRAWMTISDSLDNPDYRLLWVAGVLTVAWMSLRVFSRK
jgi:hypothetical protein